MTFFKGSRYEKVGDVETTDVRGRTIRYKRTRFIETPPVAGTHLVNDAERLDVLAFFAYGDAERWWLIADLNAAVHPEETLESGRVILMPAGQR
jgi:hypothetical protein